MELFPRTYMNFKFLFMKKLITLVGCIFINTLTAQIPSYIPTNGLVGYWPFNGNSNDESGNGNNASANGATLTVDRFGQANKAYSFDGLDDYLDVQLNQSLTFTYSVWVKFNNLNQSNQIIFQHKNNCSRGGGYMLGLLNPSNLRLIVFNCGQCSTNTCGSEININIPTISNLNTNSWYNFTLTSDGISKLKLYQNGQLIYILENSGAIVSYGTQPLTIGKWHDTPTLFYSNAINDDLCFWNRELTQDEIVNLYNSENECQTLTINTGLLSFNPPTYTNTVTVYPNPAHDKLVIDSGDLSNVLGWKIIISNALGQEVFNTFMDTQQFVVPLNTWTGQGVYFIRIYNAVGELQNTKKIILN